MTNSLKINSAAHDIHIWINEHWQDGKTFSMMELLAATKPDIKALTEGKVSGFIHRACHEGMLNRFGKRTNVKNKEYTIYILTDKTIGWAFQGPSRGSAKGRQIDMHLDQHDGLPLLDAGVVVQAAQEVITDHLAPQRARLSKYIPEPISLADQLESLAAQVEKLEKRSLEDYTDIELLDEVKRRMHP
jgi:hypothetical protein